MKRLVLGLAAAMLMTGPAMSDSLGVGTMSQGTLSFSTGSVVARVMNENMDLEAVVQPNSGETTLIPLVNSGELDFGIANVLEAAEASTGEGTFAGRPQENLRIASVLFPLRVAYFVRADSDIQTLADLEGKRITWGFSAMGSIDTVVSAILASAGLDQGDVRPVLVPNVVVGADQFVNGRADAFFFAVGAAKTAEVNASVPIRILPLPTDDEAQARMNEVFPDGYVANAPPLPNFAGVSEDTAVLGYDNLLLTNASVDDATITSVLDGLEANKEALIAGFPLFRGLKADRFFVDGLVAPFHPATEAWAAGR